MLHSGWPSIYKQSELPFLCAQMYSGSNEMMPNFATESEFINKAILSTYERFSECIEWYGGLFEPYRGRKNKSQSTTVFNKCMRVTAKMCVEINLVMPTRCVRA